MTTRTERLAEYLTPYAEDGGIGDVARWAAEILAITDDRQYASLKDFAEIIDRNRTTILSWKNRGQHDVPAPIGRSGHGDIWDADEIRRWAVRHPKLIGPDHKLFD